MQTSAFCFPYRWFACLLLIVPCSVSAQSNAPTFPPADAQLWEFGVWGAEAFGKAVGEAFGETQLTMAGFHAGRVIYERPTRSAGKRTLEYTIELQPLFLVTRPQHLYGGGFSPIGLKFNFVPRGRYRPYLEWNGGGMFTRRNVPPGNTSSFNFTLAAGPGVMIALSQTRALSVAVRYWHLSNANLGNSNPAFNTVELVAGYNWTIERPEWRKRQQAAKAPEKSAAPRPALQVGSGPAH